MANQIVVSSGAKVRDLNDVIIGTSGVLSSLAFNVANGVPKLDVNGKILVSQLPNSVMEYKGTWDASTNTPTLVNGTGNQGDVYLCNVAGTVNFGAGAIAFFVGDQVIYSGTIWQRASGATGTVTSVAVTESGDSLNITGSPITTSGTINIGFNGTNLQYINGAGDLTTFPSLTGYVPYTGATGNVDLGLNSLFAYDLYANGNGTNNANLYLKQGTASLLIQNGYSNILATGTKIGFQVATSAIAAYYADLQFSSLTAQRTYTLPDASGTLALTSQLTSGTVTSVAALTLGTTGTDLSSSVANGTTTPVITLNVPTASATNRGALSSADWTTFNGKFTLPSLTSGSVLFSNGSTISQSNANFFWDNTNGRLGIGTATPSAPLDIHATGTNATFNGTSTNNAYLVFQNAGSSKWSIGNIYNAGANSFAIYNNGLTSSAISIQSSSNDITLTGNVNNGVKVITTGCIVSNSILSVINTGSVTGTNGYSSFSGNLANNGFTFAPNNTNYLRFITPTSANYEYTFPATTGTIALTSNLSSYLPLAGGTLTGTLFMNGTGTNNAYIEFQNASTSKWKVGNTYNAGANSFDIFNSVLSTTALSISNSSNVITMDYVIKSEAAILIKNGATITAAGYTGISSTASGLLINLGNSGYNSTLTFPTTGNFTYTYPATTGTIALTSNLSSYVPLAGGTMTGLLILNNPTVSTYGLQVNNSLGNPAFVAYQNSDSSYALQVATTSATTINLNSNASASYINTAGNFGLGTASPSYKLDVVGTAKISSTLLVAGVSTFNSDINLTQGTNFAIGTTDAFALLFKTNNANKMAIYSTGNISIGTNLVDSNYKFYMKSTQGMLLQAGTNSGNYAFIINDNGGTLTFLSIRGDGLMLLGDGTNSPYNRTTGSAVNAVLLTDGGLGRNTSSIKYKKNVVNYTRGLNEILKLRPVFYEGKSEIDKGKTFAGLIAEEINELGFTEFVTYAKDGSPDALAYPNMIALLIKGIQELNDKLIKNNIN